MCCVFDVRVVLCVVCGEGCFGCGCKERCVCCVFYVCVLCVVCGEGRFDRGCKERCVCCVFDVCVVLCV